MTTKRKYLVSLRVSHPSMDPATISKELRIRPRGSWTAGEKRRTPKGEPLSGVYQDSYWYAALPSSEGLTAAELVGKTMKRLASRKTFLKRVVATGGNWQLYITGGGDRIAEEFDHSLLALLADAQGDLYLEVIRELPARRNRPSR